jgi:hypothetical protein
MAVGSTQMALKSLVSPGKAYIIRGVDATDIIPQQSSNVNFATSSGCHEVCDAVNKITTAAAAGMAAT